MKTVFRAAAVALAVLHLAGMFSGQKHELLMALSAVAVLVPGFTFMGSGYKKAAYIFLAAGVGVLIWTRQPFSVWLSAFNSMTNTVAIMVAMQLIAIPVAMGRYDESICGWVDRRIGSDKPLFAFSNLMTHLLTSILSMGAIPLSMTLLSKTIRSRMRQEEADRFISVTLSRGYVLAALWAPPAINLYLVVQSTKVSWSSLLLPGILLALLGFGLSYWMETWRGGVLGGEEEHRRAVVAQPRGGVSREGVAIAHVVVVALAIVGIVLLLEKLGVGLAYTRIMFAGIVVSILWTLLVFDKGKFVAAAKEYWEDGILKVRDLGPFFVAMGIFSGAIDASGFLKVVSPSIQAAVSWLGLLSVAVLPLCMVALSIVGFHPFITIVLFGQILAAAPLPVPILSVALSLAVGGAAAYMISPFAGIVMSIARYTGAKASRISLQWNGKYSIAFFFAGVIFSIVWGALVGR